LKNVSQIRFSLNLQHDVIKAEAWALNNWTMVSVVSLCGRSSTSLGKKRTCFHVGNGGEISKQIISVEVLAYIAVLDRVPIKSEFASYAEHRKVSNELPALNALFFSLAN
jgi:hypothetical protein